MGWLELWKFHSTALLAGCALDWMFGDPVCIPHLVRIMGRMIARLELELRRRMRGRELAAGAVLTFIMCAVWWMVPWGLFRLVRSAGFPGSFLFLFCLETFICYQMMAARGLCTESMKVCRSLEDGEVEIARHHVSMIVGRDTSVLDRDGIARAAVETVAENASDGVVAPFLFMALLGPAGGTFYKAVNTMDSMIGYKNDTYRFFGRTAALLDDVLNLIPARVTGCLMVLAAFFIPGMDGMNGWRIFLRDRKKHASPNSAHGEAACAGILHLRLAG
ncbi:MAG: cobalamin biosynthesis protein CobD, partial [Clostridium sp.]|nr:cobalamin biosynthesis protein CobD [Clostridium sp.]